MESFWNNFFSNLLSTLIGVAVGLPVALKIDRKIRKRNRIEKESEEKKHRDKILKLIISEIDECIDSMNKVHKDMAEYYYPVRTETWNAFSDGGELQWIKDVDLLNDLSIGYAKINTYSFALTKYYETYFYLVGTNNLQMASIQLQHLIKIKEEVLKTIVPIRSKLNKIINSAA
jgi:hypothetical protein